MSEVRKSLVATFIGNYSGLAISILTSVVLARLLTPAETGMYTISAGIVSIVQVVREFGTGNYILQEKDLTRSKISGALGVSIGFGVLLAILFFATSGEIGRFYGHPRLATVVRVLSINFLLVGFASIGMARLRRDMRFDSMMWVGIIQTATHASVAIFLARLGFGAVAMAWASVVSVSVTVVGCWILLREDFLLWPQRGSWREPLHFGVYSCAAYLLQALSLRMPDILIGRILGLDLAGIYSRGNGLITLFEQAVMSVITPVATSALAQVNRQDADVVKAYLRFTSYVTVVTWPCLGMMCILALPIIDIAFGAQWLPAVGVARIMCGSAALIVLGTTATSLMTAIGAVRPFFAMQVVSVPFELAALLIGTMRFGIEGAAWGMTVWSAMIAALSLWQATRAVGAARRALAAPIGNGLLALASTMVLPIAVIIFYPITLADLLAPSGLASAGGLVGWLAFIFISGHPVRQELILILARLIKPLAARRAA